MILVTTKLCFFPPSILDNKSNICCRCVIFLTTVLTIDSLNISKKKIYRCHVLYSVNATALVFSSATIRSVNILLFTLGRFVIVFRESDV